LSNIKIKYKSGNSSNDLKDNPGRHHHPSFANPSKLRLHLQMRQHNSKGSSFTPFKSGSSWKKPSKPVVAMDECEKEDFFDATSEKMAIHVEKLEKLFYEKLYLHEPREKTKKMLCSIVPAALAMPDPIMYIQDQFAYYSRQYYSAKMINYVATSCGIDTFKATEYLKNVLLARYLCK
jgi:hypothetical protein